MRWAKLLRKRYKKGSPRLIFYLNLLAVAVIVSKFEDEFLSIHFGLFNYILFYRNEGFNIAPWTVPDVPAVTFLQSYPENVPTFVSCADMEMMPAGSGTC